MKQLRILAPVGGQEQLLAAVRCGADAVYLGAKGFNARKNAENFAADSLLQAVAYCHEHNVSVLVTLNTLILDEELPRLIAELDEIAAARADAVIVQDLLVARLIRERYPALPIVASTQMAVHNAEGAKLVESLGITQVVLARELSLEEIKSIRAETTLELESFVHGALCMCLSGACYLSSVIGTRSGNRGLCAQPCRTNFRLDGREYALSLKDMTSIPHLTELREAGVTALKIEGRMKRPEYVAVAVTACRQALSGGTPDMGALAAVFSRSGFTDGYLTARRTSDMFGRRTREDVAAAQTVLPRLAALYQKEPPMFPVDMALAVQPGQPAALTVTDGAHFVAVTGATPETARTLPLTHETAKRSLAKTGGTPYVLRTLETKLADGLTLPASQLNALRRDALQALASARSRRPPYASTGWTPPALPAHKAPGRPALRLRFASLSQFFDASDAEKILLPIEALEQEPSLIASLGDRLILELPAVCFPDAAPRLQKRLEALCERGLSAVAAENAGALFLGRALGLRVHGGASLNILNGYALEEYARLGLADATVSFELSMARIKKLGGDLPRGVLGYGYLPLMRMRACPARGKDGCGDCPGVHTLTDEKNERFTLVCQEKRYVELLNSVPLYIGDKPLGGLDFVTLRFTVESRSEAERVCSAFQAGETPDFRRTGGLYYRELQ